MKRLALVLAALLACGTASGQSVIRVSTETVRVSGTSSTTEVPGGCSAGSVLLLLGSPVGFACDDGLTFEPTLNALAGTGPWTVTPSTDVTALTIRRHSDAQTAPILLVQTQANATLARIDVDGTVAATELQLLAPNDAPASATAACTAGEMRWTSTHFYFCPATNTWVRAALATWP